MTPQKDQSAIESNASNSPAPQMLWARVIQYGGQIAPAAGALIGLGYLSGYLIVNWYLGYRGVRLPNLPVSRYLAAGILYILSTALPMILLSTYFRYIGQADPKASKGRRFRRSLMVILLACVLLLLISGLFAGFITRNAQNTLFIQSVTIESLFVFVGLALNTVVWLFIVLFVTRSLSGDKDTKAQERSSPLLNYAMLSIQGIIIFCLSLGLYTGLVYPFTNPAFGGGAASRIKMLVDPDSLVTQTLPMSQQRGMTDEIGLIDQTMDGYIIKIPSGQIIIVPNDQVRGVLIGDN